MKNYLEYLHDVMTNGTQKGDRTGTGTVSVFGRQMRFDLSKGLPVVTTKKIHLKSIIHELLWFISGETNIKYLKDNGVKIWDEWADKDGNLGPVYGFQWRHWPKITINETDPDYIINHNDGSQTFLRSKIHVTEVDQIKQLIDTIKQNPNSRRMIVNAWNVSKIDEMALPPCHAFFQFYVANGKLSCQLYQRSVDSFLGLPFNIVCYSLLTHMVAQQTGLEVGDFVWTGGDCHIYNNHFEQIKEQLSRTPRALPTLKFARKPDSIFDYKYEDFMIDGYDPHPLIKAPVAV